MPCATIEVVSPEKPTKPEEAPDVWSWFQQTTFGVPNWALIWGAVAVIGALAYVSEEERRRELMLLLARR